MIISVQPRIVKFFFSVTKSFFSFSYASPSESTILRVINNPFSPKTKSADVARLIANDYDEAVSSSSTST